MALRFPHPQFLHHKPAFFSIRLFPLLCVNYPPISRSLSCGHAHPIWFSLVSRKFKTIHISSLDQYRVVQSWVYWAVDTYMVVLGT